MATPRNMRSLAEHHLTQQIYDGNAPLVGRAVLLTTDPSTQMHREGCSGVLMGKMNVEVKVNVAALQADTVIWCVQWQKYDVALYPPNHQHANMLAISSCKPSYANVVVLNSQTPMSL